MRRRSTTHRRHGHGGRTLSPRAARAMRARRWMREHPARGEIIKMLEEYQRDLEEETAVVAEQIRRLREESTD